MKRGFTMIELLLAVMLLAIMTVVTGLTFNTIVRNWQRSMDYIDGLQRAEYGMRQIVSGIKSAYCPPSGDNTGRYGFMVAERGTMREAQSDIEWTKIGTSIIGSRSAISDVPHRVRLWVKDDLESDETPGLYASVKRIDLVPEGEEEEIKEREDEIFEEGFLLVEGIRRFECRVLKSADSAYTADNEYDWKKADEWTGADTNKLPYKVELTFELEPVERDAEPAIIKRIVEIPLWNISQNPLTDDDSTGKGDSKKRVKAGGAR